ncbi:MAG: O-methyltransferase [Nonlabens sp.]|uniref:O-methyltransferase n=1 Tax=Nonlabens sp. TaxID=1888209 RepID=UPI003EF65D85
MLHQLKHYIKHSLKSFHLHGIHSPFVFTLEKKCLRDKDHYEQYGEMLRFRESLQYNHTILNIKDYGAGSRVFKSNVRKVSDILKHNSSDQKSAALLMRLCSYFKVQQVLELGTSLGIATQAMAISKPDVHITTVEGSPEVQQFAVQSFNDLGLKNIISICSKFTDFLADHDSSYDLIYIDGHHDGAATLAYFESCLRFAHNNTVFVLDDIYWSGDMTAAWDQLCHHSQVTASVDLYDLGLLFLRKEQLQERFYIKL